MTNTHNFFVAIFDATCLVNLIYFVHIITIQNSEGKYGIEKKQEEKTTNWF
jgi:hypothetical protein